MTSKQFGLLFVILCGISMHAVLGQLGILNTPPDGSIDNNTNSPGVRVQEDSGTIDEMAETPEEEQEDEDDIYNRVNQVDSIEDFVALLQLNGRQLTTSDLHEEREQNTDGKQSISTGGRMATPDNCSPRNTTIRIEMQEETDSDTIFFPRCTKVERCGGCCSSQNLECVPSYTERIRLKVLKGKVPYPGATHMEYTGFAAITVDRHVTCRVRCTLNAEKCGPKKEFYRHKCRCKCRYRGPCPVPTVWDQEDCTCKCPHVTECCRDGDHCGMVWNPLTCQCDIQNDGRIAISAGGNSQNASLSQSNNAQTTTRVSTTPTTTTSTSTLSTTTTTTTTTTPFDPCSTRVCPPRFIKVPRGNSCRCRPPIRFGGRTRPRFRG